MQHLEIKSTKSEGKIHWLFPQMSITWKDLLPVDLHNKKC